MALQQDTVSINMATGINDKIDEKIAGPNQTAVLRDARFTKDKRLEKRFGMTNKTTTSVNVPSGGVAIGTSLHPTKIFEHENQLCMINNGSLYSQLENQDKWLFKGYALPLNVSIEAVKGDYNLFDTATVSGITASIGVNIPYADSYGTIIVKENSTGVVMKVTSIQNPVKLIAFSNALWVLWYDYAATSLKAQQISLTDGSLGTAVTLQTDAYIFLPNKISVAMTTSSSVIGEAAMIAYHATTNTYKVFPMDSSGSVLSLGKLDTTHTAADNYGSCCNIYIEPTVNQNRFWFGSSISTGVTTCNAYSQSWTFTTSAYTSVYAKVSANSFPQQQNNTTTPTSKLMGNITQAINPENNTELYFFTDTINAYNYDVTSVKINYVIENYDLYSTDNFVYYTVLNFSGSITRAATIYGMGYSIAANAIRDTQRKTIYVPCGTYSPLQSAIYLMDILKGRSTSYYLVDSLANKPSPLTYAHAKALNGLAIRSQQINTCSKPSANQYELINNGYLVKFNLVPEYAQQSQYFSKTTHLTGGELWAYDGETVSEHNFFEAPDVASVFYGQEYLTLISSGASKTFGLTPQCASSWVKAALGNYAYVTYNNGANRYIWFTIDGSGTNPAPAGYTGTKVELTSYDSSFDIVTKIADVFASFSASTPADQNPATICTGYYNDTAPMGAAPLIYDNTAAGTKAAGTYKYAFCYKWTDRNGQIYRSNTNVEIVVTTTVANSRTAGLVWVPPITNKEATTVYLECYRSQLDGTVLQLFKTQALSPINNRIYFVDNFSDEDIVNNEPLYTTGGVLGNTNIGACKSVSFFKSRLVVTPVDDQLAIYYSKTAQANSPIDFSAELYFREDADQDPVSAAVQMDDKLIVFKPNKVYVHSGDGANDIGTGVTLSPAILIATDVGTSNPNSVILYPNGLLFKSEKGIYVLDRGLSTGYIGSSTESYNPLFTSGAILMEDVSEVRFFNSDSGTSIVYNYFFERWDTFTNMQADSVCMWRGKPTRVTNAGKAFVETTNYYDVDDLVTVPISLYWKSPWMKLKGIQDFQRIYELNFLGEYKSPHTVNIYAQYDYDTTTAADVYTVNAEELVTGTFPGDSVYQFQVNLIRQKCQSLQITLIETPTGGSEQSLYLNDMAMTVGLKKGLNKIPARKQV